MSYNKVKEKKLMKESKTAVIIKQENKINFFLLPSNNIQYFPLFFNDKNKLLTIC